MTAHVPITLKYSKHERWLIKIEETYGSKSFTSKRAAIDFDVKPDYIKRVCVALFDLGLVKKIGSNSGTRWQVNNQK